MLRRHCLRAIIVTAVLGLSQSSAMAEAFCKTITGYGQSTQIVAAADGARRELARQAYAAFGVRPVRHRLPGLINYRFSCHESRRSGQVIHHCRASGTLCRVQGPRRLEAESLGPRRF